MLHDWFGSHIPTCSVVHTCWKGYTIYEAESVDKTRMEKSDNVMHEVREIIYNISAVCMYILVSERDGKIII